MKLDAPCLLNNPHGVAPAAAATAAGASPLLELREVRELRVLRRPPVAAAAGVRGLLRVRLEVHRNALRAHREVLGDLASRGASATRHRQRHASFP